jgi:hypothetical protein
MEQADIVEPSTTMAHADSQLNLHTSMNSKRPPLIVKRRRFKHIMSFEQRLADEAARLREAANKLPDGSRAQEVLLKRARQTEAASQINDWLRSPGLQPPTDMARLLSGKR